MRRLQVIAVVVGTVLAAGGAKAATIDFTVDLANSSVAITDQSGGGLLCAFSSCGIEANLASGLGGTSFSLGEGGSFDFDFIEFTADGTAGILGRSFDITATLAFDPPSSSTTGSGDGRGFFVAGVITGGVLTWDDVPSVQTLSDGSVITVDFQSGITILPLTTSVVTSASVYVNSVAPVPEPGAAMLFGVSGLVLSVFGRRRNR